MSLLKQETETETESCFHCLCNNVNYGTFWMQDGGYIIRHNHRVTLVANIPMFPHRFFRSTAIYWCKEVFGKINKLCHPHEIFLCNRCCAHPKAGWNPFFGLLSTFLVDFRHFLLIFQSKTRKSLKNSVSNYSWKLVDTQILDNILLGVPQFCLFQFICPFFGLFSAIYGKFNFFPVQKL